VRKATKCVYYGVFIPAAKHCSIATLNHHRLLLLLLLRRRRRRLLMLLPECGRLLAEMRLMAVRYWLLARPRDHSASQVVYYSCKMKSAISRSIPTITSKRRDEIMYGVMTPIK
jgi:hypothetical protein